MPSGSDSGTNAPESGCDTCAICLQDVGQDEAFLDNCYHRFHWHCVSSWTEAQKSHPSPSAAPFCCPLCKAPYASILHTFRDNTFRQEWVASGELTCAPSLILTPEQTHRRSLYFQPEPTTLAGGAQQRTAVITSLEVQAWITRELQAITLEQDVKLLCQVVLGCLPTVVQSVQNTGRRPAAAIKLEYSGLTGNRKQQWMDQVTAAVQPFIPDHAQQFAQHLLGFLASKLSIAGYDRLVFGETAGPSQAQAQSSSGVELKSEDESQVGASSSTSNQSSHGAGSDTGSDAYVELLRHQAGGSTCRQHTMAMQDAAVNGTDQFALLNNQEASVSATEAPYDSAAVSVMSSGLSNQTDNSRRLGIAGGIHKHRHKRKSCNS